MSPRNASLAWMVRFMGIFFRRSAAASPGRLKANDFFMRVIEAEFAFQMARDLPPVSKPRGRNEVAAAVEGVLPGIEIVDSRFDDWTTIGALSLTADNACNAAWVRGALLKDWQSIDLGGSGGAAFGEWAGASRGYGRQCFGTSAKCFDLARKYVVFARIGVAGGAVCHYGGHHGGLHGGAWGRDIGGVWSCGVCDVGF